MSFTLSLTSCLNPAFKIFTCVLLTLWKGWSTQVFKYKKQGIMQTNMSGRILFIFNVRNQYLVLKRTFLMLLIGFIIWKIKWRVFSPLAISVWDENGYYSVLDDPGAPKRTRLSTLPDLCHVPDCPKIHGLWLVLWSVLVGERVPQSLEKRVLPTWDLRSEI